MRTAVFAVLLVAALGLGAGCQSSPAKSDEAAPKASTYEGEGTPKIKFKDDHGTPEGSEPAPGALAYAAVPFQNLVYIPWKLIGGGGKGAVDGVTAGFAKDRMPILGIVFAPLNVIVGFATGAVETVATSPVFIGPTDSFGHAMAQPTRHVTAIWWYE